MVEDGFLYFLLVLEVVFIVLLGYGIIVKVSQIIKRKDLTQNTT